MQKIATALVKFRSQCPTIFRDGLNPHFHSTFATLKSIHKAIDKPLAENGLMVMQFPSSGDGVAGCLTRVIHESGEMMEHEFLIPYTKNDPQAACSAVSYARRHGISGALGLVTDDDDDANSIVEAPPAKHRPSPKKGKDARLDTESKQKMLSAAENRIKELEIDEGVVSGSEVCAEVLKAKGYASSIEAKQSDFADLFSAIQSWEPGGTA